MLSLLQIRRWVVCAQTWFGSAEWFDRSDAVFASPCESNGAVAEPASTKDDDPKIHSSKGNINTIYRVSSTYINLCYQLNVIVLPSLKTNAAVSLEGVTNAQVLCLQVARRRRRRRLFHGRITDRALSSRTPGKYCHVTASNCHSYADASCELTTLISNSIQITITHRIR